MLNIQFLPAKCGDAIIIKHSDSTENSFLIVIDFGKEKSQNYPLLLAELKAALREIGKIDLFIITHMDDDHIGGILKLFKSNETDITTPVIEWWLNHSLEAEMADSKNNKISKKQNVDLKEFLTKKGCCPIEPIIKPFSKEIKKAIIKVLSPNLNGYNLAKNIALAEELKRNSLIGAKISDHGYSIEELKIKAFNEDDSPTNNSSIAFLFTLGKINGLFLADALPGVVVDSLNELGFNTANKLKLDFVKISHHGSRRNTSNELLDVIDSQNYIISCNGDNSHNLPDKESLVRILMKGNKERPVDIYFTHSDDTLRQIFNQEEQNNPEYHFTLHFSDNILNLTFSP